MKIALCLYGKVGFKTGKADRRDVESIEILKASFEKYQSNLIAPYGVDVYIHSWSTSLKDNILDLYKPQNFVIETQKNFEINHSFERSFLYSRFYSAYSVTELIDKNKKYDLIIMSRFDLEWNITDLSLFNPQKFNVAHYCGYGDSIGADDFLWGKWRSEKKRPFWSASELHHFHYDVEDYGIFDHWFASSQEDMLTFGKLYLHLDEIRSKAKKNKHGVMNPHLMILFYLKKTGLFEKINFTSHYLDTPLIRRSVFNEFS